MKMNLNLPSPKRYPVGDVKTFWHAIGVRAVGTSVVTANGLSGPAGFLALSVAHLSASPPSMLVGVGKKTTAISAIRESAHFAINCLASDQVDLADVFGGRRSVNGADRFSFGHWGVFATGAPILLNGLGAIECDLDEIIERHDTFIVIGKIREYMINSDRAPLVSFGGGYLNGTCA
jgi:flavin reductase (DIM6/NTAB) family NADH-FMN oxidoreductase RutF